MTEKKTTKLKKRIKTEKGLWNPLCYDCVSAKIFDKAGADLIAVSGYGISMSLLGLPDMGFISLPELAMVTRYVVNAVDAPVIADADTGFGNALNVLRTTREIIRYRSGSNASRRPAGTEKVRSYGRQTGYSHWEKHWENTGQR